MFGYLNLNDPTKIGNNEAQEATNVRMDKGYLEYAEWSIDEDINRAGKDVVGRGIFIKNLVGDLGPGRIYRQLTSTREDIVGTPLTAEGPTDWNPGTAALSKPLLGATSGTISIYYALTAYNAETNEESEPYFFTHLSDGTTAFQITDFPGYSTRWPEKLEAEWRLYRRPVGSAEYLQVPLSPNPIQAYLDNSTVYSDTYEDNELGLPLNSIDCHLPAVYSVSGYCDILTIHNNRLWFTRYGTESPTAIPNIGQIDGHVLYFSKPYIFGEVNQLNYFVFDSPIVALFSADEALTVLTADKLYVIYGDDEDDFIVKENSTSETGGALNYSAMCVGGTGVFLGSQKSDRSKGSGIYITRGSELTKVSFQIENLFPIEPKFAYNYVVDVYRFASKQEEDRFFIVRYRENSEDKYLIYDLATNGFLLGDNSGTFKYHSKDFGRPGWWDKATRMFVRGLGDFTVEIYGDGEKIDEITFSLSGSIPQTESFTVPPYRNNYFSFRFIGQQNAKIYEFGRKE